MKEMILRFLLGGAVVTLFAALGDIFKRKSFACCSGRRPSSR